MDSQYQELEYNLLAALCDSEEIKYVLDGVIKDKWFISKRAAAIWEYIKKCVLEQDKIPSRAAIKEALDEILPNSSELHVTEHIEKIRKEYKARILKSVGQDLVKQYELREFDRAKDKISYALAELNETETSKIIDISEEKEVDRILKEYELRAQHGTESNIEIETPWRQLTDKTYGIKKGNLWTIVGDSGIGKTFFICLFAEHAWKQGKKVLFVSMEMTDKEITERILAIGAKISIRNYRLGALGEKDTKEMDRFSAYLKDIKKRQSFYIVNASDIECTQQLPFFIRNMNPDVVFIDSVYDLRARGNNIRSEYEAIAESCRLLRKYIQEYNIPMVVSTQFQRGGKKQHEIGYSIRFLQDSSVVLGVYKLEKKQAQEIENADNMRKVVILKNRHGACGAFLVEFDVENMSFEYIMECKE